MIDVSAYNFPTRLQLDQEYVRLLLLDHQSGSHFGPFPKFCMHKNSIYISNIPVLGMLVLHDLVSVGHLCCIPLLQHWAVVSPVVIANNGALAAMKQSQFILLVISPTLEHQFPYMQHSVLVCQVFLICVALTSGSFISTLSPGVGTSWGDCGSGNQLRESALACSFPDLQQMVHGHQGLVLIAGSVLRPYIGGTRYIRRTERVMQLLVYYVMEQYFLCN